MRGVLLCVASFVDMAELPELPSGVDQTSTLLGVTWTFTVVGTIFVIGRLYCRLNFGIFGWDDFWMTLTSVSTVFLLFARP